MGGEHDAIRESEVINEGVAVPSGEALLRRRSHRQPQSRLIGVKKYDRNLRAQPSFTFRPRLLFGYKLKKGGESEKKKQS